MRVLTAKATPVAVVAQAAESIVEADIKHSMLQEAYVLIEGTAKRQRITSVEKSTASTMDIDTTAAGEQLTAAEPVSAAAAGEELTAAEPVSAAAAGEQLTAAEPVAETETDDASFYQSF